MEDVRIYDFACNLLHIEHNIVSCNWTFYENDIGIFEMHFPLSGELTKIVAQERYLVAVQGNKQAIITGRQFLNEGVLYGRSCNWLLTRFCIAEPFNTDALFENGVIAAKDAQTVCRYLIEKGLGSESDFVFQENEEAGFSEVYLENNEVTSVFTLIREVMHQAGGGHSLKLDVTGKRWVFSPTMGKTLPVTLSEDNRNAYESEYCEDMLNFFAGGYYKQKIENKGEWDIYANSPALYNNQSENYATGYRVSLSERETGYESFNRFGFEFRNGDYIVCKNRDGVWEKAYNLDGFTERIEPTLSGVYAWETMLDGQSLPEAEQNLVKRKVMQEITVKTRDFIFERDYFLGDSVMQRLEKGSFSSCVVRKITGVNLWYETEEVGEQPIFSEEEVKWVM